jgi:hypothetical protein
MNHTTAAILQRNSVALIAKQDGGDQTPPRSGLGSLRGITVAGAIGLSVIALAPRDSTACLNETERVVAPSTGALVAAEKQANEGNLDAALKSLMSAQPRISIASAGMSADKDRAIRVASRILARASTAPFPNFPNDEEQLKWGFLNVRKMRDKAPDDPSILTDFGEIGARLPTERHEAMQVLASLEEKDLVASAYGYATLARLRAELGADTAKVASAPLRALEAGKREISMMRCKKLAKDPALCDRGLIAVAKAQGGAPVEVNAPRDLGSPRSLSAGAKKL